MYISLSRKRNAKMKESTWLDSIYNNHKEYHKISSIDTSHILLFKKQWMKEKEEKKYHKIEIFSFKNEVKNISNFLTENDN